MKIQAVAGVLTIEIPLIGINVESVKAQADDYLMLIGGINRRIAVEHSLSTRDMQFSPETVNESQTSATQPEVQS